jgi:NADPH:quinone reductase
MQIQAIILEKKGDAKNLKNSIISLQAPKKNEVQIRHSAIGINFFDVCFRRGQYKISKYPATLGMQACGYIEALGSEVKDFKVGDRVAYATGGIGAYCQKRNIHQHHLIAIKHKISDEQVAAVLHNGMLVHALLHRVYIAKRAKRALIHSAAGSVGHILCQWAKYLGIDVIATVGDDSKIDFVKSLGVDKVINYRKNNFVDEVARLTQDKGVGIVYDGVGKDTLSQSIDCLWPMGICVNYGDSSGEAKDFNVDQLFYNSVFLTKPLMALYKSNRVELTLSANEVLTAVEKSIIKPKITTYDFNNIVKAHMDLESRKTTGSLILIPPKS